MNTRLRFVSPHSKVIGSKRTYIYQPPVTWMQKHPATQTVCVLHVRSSKLFLRIFIMDNIALCFCALSLYTFSALYCCCRCWLSFDIADMLIPHFRLLQIFLMVRVVILTHLVMSPSLLSS